MNAVIVYESLWGNTAAVARAVAEGMGPGARALTTDEATPAVVAAAETLVVGAPVIAFGLASEKTRDGIRDPANPPDVAHPSLKSWLEALPDGHAPAAAFETRLWWSPRGAPPQCAPRRWRWSPPPPSARDQHDRAWPQGSRLQGAREERAVRR